MTRPGWQADDLGAFHDAGSKDQAAWLAGNLEGGQTPVTTNLRASAQLAEARAAAAAVRAMYSHLVQDHECSAAVVGPMTLTQLEEHHTGLDADWTWGSNEPGCLPDTDTPAETACWWDARDALAEDLEHEGRVAEDNEAEFNDSEALLAAAHEVLEHRPNEGIELVLKDGTGRDRAFWLQRAE